jgi:hypothetical protein
VAEVHSVISHHLVKIDKVGASEIFAARRVML